MNNYHVQRAKKYDTVKECQQYTGETVRSTQRAAEYYRELEQMKICTNPGFGLIFFTHQGREKQENFHCGNEISMYQNNCDQGIIDRRTPYGFGIPKQDMKLFNQTAIFGKQQQRWKCLLCNYKRDRCQWYQVFGHIAATHGHTSRVPNKRRGIKLPGRHEEQETPILHANIKQHLSAEIYNGGIHLYAKQDGNTMWKCGQCVKEYSFDHDKGVTTQIGKCTMEQDKETYYAHTARQPSQTRTILNNICSKTHVQTEGQTPN